MLLTGMGFAGFTAFWLSWWWRLARHLILRQGSERLLPTEQAALAQTVSGPSRNQGVRWYTSWAAGGHAVGSLNERGPDAISSQVETCRCDACPSAASYSTRRAHQSPAAAIYLTCRRDWSASRRRPGARWKNRAAIVLRLADLFSVDSFGGRIHRAVTVVHVASSALPPGHGRHGCGCFCRRDDERFC